MDRITDPVALFHSLSDPSRLRLLRLLGREELNVQELVRVTGLSQPSVSRHLAVLREQGWLNQRSEGTWNWYRTVDPAGFPFGRDVFATLTSAADGVAEAARDDRTLAAVLAERQKRERDFFSGLADHWDRIREEYEHPDIRLGTVGALVDRRLRVLDIGTGTGAMLPVFAEHAGAVVALDHSEAMLARARTLVNRQGLERVQLCSGDIEALPFRDGVFDVCHCAMVLHHVTDPGAAVAQMARVVRPGGRVVVTAFCPHREEWMREELAHQWLGFERAQMEGFMAAAGLVPVGYLERGRLTEGGTVRRAPVGGPKPRWPDVFLATGERPDDRTDDSNER